MNAQSFSLEWGGRELTIETGKLAQQTSGSCTVRYGGTVVLATAVMAPTVREGIDYFPLMVDYEEKLYAAGKIKGSRFIKRETRPSDDAITIARMVDRSLRPLFNQETRRDVQVILTTLSFDNENDSDIVSLIAASAALSLSDIPWDGPVAGVRVGQIVSDDGTKKEWALNPTYDARDKSLLDLVIVGDGERVLMLEAGANEVLEQDIFDAITFAQKHIRKAVELIRDAQKTAGKQKQVIVSEEDEETRAAKALVREHVETFVREHAGDELFDTTKTSKHERKAALGALLERLNLHLQEKNIGKDKRKGAGLFFTKEIERVVSQAILEKKQRVDGRTLTDIRPLGVEIGLLPRTHGSALFTRGDTHVLSIVTLGSPSDQQIIEGLEDEEKKRYMHHYNFPPYSVNEVKPLRGASRRDVGHGALAEKALVPVLPDKEAFPYTIRVVSEVLSSNGSSSMASVCGSSLALMDAGVPIKKAVAGIAMGLASSDDVSKWTVLTDLQDLEDGPGGMDFKVAGTDTGITAIQLDTKTKGLPLDLLQQTLTQAREARLALLATMGATIPTPRPELSQYAPRIISMRIKPDMIRNVIGPGGKIINEIIDATGVDIDIEDDGLVFITSVNAEKAQEAVEWVKRLTREVVAGEIFEGKVTRLMNFGAFVEILPRQEGLVHISELAPYHVNQVEDIVKIGQTIPVKVIEIDDMGRINLSLKQTDYKDYPPAPTGGEQSPHRGFGGSRGGFRSGGPPRGGSRGPRPHRPRF